MEDREEFKAYKEELLGMVNSINSEIPLTEENQVLIVYELDTTEKIRAWFRWIVTNMKDGKLQATEEEIVRAAVKASKGLI